jgi:hypothetical protein
MGSREYSRHGGELNVKMKVKLATDTKTEKPKLRAILNSALGVGEKSARSYIYHFPEKNLGILR